MSATPRTDKAELVWQKSHGTPPSVSAYFARELESELQIATELLKEAERRVEFAATRTFASETDERLLVSIRAFLSTQTNPAPKG